jgi:cytochrome c-type biogenesis protein CcmH/NrfG
VGRHGGLAVLLAEAACEGTDYRRPEQLDALAAAYAEAGRFDNAVAMLEKAMTLLPPSSAERAQMQKRLRLYERGQPFHQPPQSPRETPSPR